ncbi:MAG: PH domain-containing protein [Microbacteriaceae bacterium]
MHNIELSEDGWRRISKRQVLVEYVNSLWYVLPMLGPGIVLSILWQPYGFFILGAGVIIFIWVLVLIPRRVRNYGYLLREDDLLFRRGIMFRRFVSVPYGRMQLVDITRGPLERSQKLATLKLVTAAASTGVMIPGLPIEEAEGLRDHLVAVAESRRAGL